VSLHVTHPRGWNELLGAVRNEFALPPRLRELAICVELLGVIATYNMVSRFLVALEVGPET
jgi:hypothetical protein